MTWRVLIVDDERLARAELRRLLAPHATVEVAGEAANIEDAQRLIEAQRPDLVFLDVQMPGGSGFDLLAALDAAPEVIFTTAFDAYALKAFEVNALDYLQKPIEPARLAAALARAEARLRPTDRTQPESAETAPDAASGPLRAEHKIFIKDGERCWFVALAQIALFESEGNYTRVYFDTNRPLVLRSLNQLETRLDQRRYFRANRRHIVNLEYVARVETADSGALTMVLNNGVQIEVSRRRAAEFKALAML